MTSRRSTLYYTLFATTLFLGWQWLDGIRDWVVLLSSGLMFLTFTYLMMRLVNAVMPIVFKPRAQKLREEQDATRGPAAIAPTSDRIEHNRRRRERSRRR